MTAKAEVKERKLIASNRRARFDYEILDTFEAGLSLLGPEVKSLRGGKASLAEAFAVVRRGQAYLVGCHIPPYLQAGRENPDPLRERKLLLHRREIAVLEGGASERGFTIIPLELYFSRGRAKLSLALARGKRRYDKRETIRKREEDREVARTLRRGRRT